MVDPSSSRAQHSSFVLRVATGIAYACVFVLAALVAGPYGVALVCAALAAAAVSEFVSMARDHKSGFARDSIAIASCAATPIAAAAGGFLGVIGVLAGTVLAVGVRHLAQAARPLSHSSVTLAGCTYVGLSLAHLVLISELDRGIELALIVIAGVWANDVFAYVVGSKLGRHKMAPVLSPNKSWEGFAAGTIAAAATWSAAGYAVDTGIEPPVLVAIGVILSIVAAGGDLFESRIKRQAGVKDSGSSLPGHGGFLDRIDSMIPVSIVGYYLLLIAGGI